MVEDFVIWWCRLLGVFDPTAQSIAVGVVAGGLLLFILWVVGIVAVTLMAASQR